MQPGLGSWDLEGVPCSSGALWHQSHPLHQARTAHPACSRPTFFCATQYRGPLCFCTPTPYTHNTHTHTQRGSCKYNSRIQSSAGGKVHQALGCLLGSVWHLTQALSHKLPIIHCYWRDSSTHFKVYSSAETSTVLVSVLWKRSPLCPFKFGYRPRCCAELELFLQLESIVVSFPQEHHGTCKESPRVLAALVTRC